MSNSGKRPESSNSKGRDPLPPSKKAATEPNLTKLARFVHNLQGKANLLETITTYVNSKGFEDGDIKPSPGVQGVFQYLTSTQQIFDENWDVFVFLIKKHMNVQ